jgi:hypothetical protein
LLERLQEVGRWLEIWKGTSRLHFLGIRFRQFPVGVLRWLPAKAKKVKQLQ